MSTVALVDTAQLATTDTAFKGRVKAAMAVEALALCALPQDPATESDQAYRRRLRAAVAIVRDPDGLHNAMVWMVAATPGITSAASDAAILEAVRTVLANLTKEA